MRLSFSKAQARKLAAAAPFAAATALLALAAFTFYPHKPPDPAADEDEVLVVGFAEIKQFGGGDVRWRDLQSYYGLSEDQIDRSIDLTAERNGQARPRNENRATRAANRVADSGDPIVISLSR
ncbi:MAG: hypothetical protein JOZ90_16245 [Alphaproteobacteria bacterium]|nr:hypothetical protein [Alphaproteobacteria bacterium]MBV9371992.1 hypothetical protein [Alphaproteobacteria bacterium]MBV9902623.1 hypothetical protein [Alphaproteobacteria bacterium]